MKSYLLKLPILLLFLFVGCGTESDPDDESLGNVFVLNEGNIGQANASITSYNPETGVATQNVYESVNGSPIGDALHSSTLIDDRLYLVVNNSHKIEVVEPESFVNIGTINIADEASPRYIEKVAENKAYVTNLYAGTVSIIDLENMQESGTITVGSNPEGIAVVGTKAFVANSGFGSGNTVSVINTETDEVEETITVGNNPVDVKADASGRVWVVCVGAYDDFETDDVDESTAGEIYVLNGETGAVIEQITVGGHPGELVIDSEYGQAFLSNGTVFQINTTTFEIENERFIDRGFYALGLTTINDEIYLFAADAGNFSQDGKAFQYNMSATKIDSFSTGIIPGHFYFN